MPRGRSKSAKSTEAQQPDYVGHRKRLRKRFVNNGFDGMLEHEVLELVLTLFIPRRDVKPLSRQLLRQYAGVLNVIAAPRAELENQPGMGESSAIGLKILFEFMIYCLEEKCHKLDLLENTEAVCNFARMKIGVLHRESCMAIFLNSRNKLIEYKIYEGTVDHVYTYPRNLAEEAILCHASKLILIHNHPSGDYKPTIDDLETTCAIHDALKSVSIQLADHIIITQYGYFSFLAHDIPLNKKPEDYAL